MKPFTDNLKKEIDVRIKNKIDISDLIKGVDIKGQDFSRAIIKDFNIINGDISNCLFFQATIGEEDKVTNLSGTRMRNTNFKQAKFLGETWFKGVDARGACFISSYIPYPNYQFGDFRGATFCGTVTKLSSNHYKGAKFDIEFLQDLANMLNLKITINQQE